MGGTLAARASLMSLGLALSSCVWVLRPHVLTLFLLAVLVTLLARARWRWIPPLFLLWANAGGRGRAAAGPADRARALALSLVLVTSGLACAAAPLGFGIYRFVIESTARSMQVKITEWFPVTPNDVFGVLFWAATIGFVALLAVRVRS